ncbi:LysR family transcriptional regulator [Ideonella sp.]|uniref:LysR family transcriptional regulator n=1 Tax=Ideonella sp. TaxID=1929293 RepID=UPI0035B1AC30
MAKPSRSLACRSSVAESELRLLRTFAAVVAAGGFSTAAAELEVDLSTVSKQFRELEQWLGVTLARRGRGGFRLTAEGERLHALTRQFFGGMQAFSQDLAALALGQRPLLRLGVVDALLTAGPVADGRQVSAALARCLQALPGLQLQLRALRPQDIERELLAGTLDAGLTAARPPARGLEQHRLYREPSSLYVGPGHPWHAEPGRARSDEELAAVRLVVDPYLDGVPPNGLAPALARGGHARADSIEAAALLVASGHFAGFLPDHLVRGTAALAGLSAVQPDRFSYAQDIVLTCRAGKAEPPVRQLLRALLD